MEQNKLNQVISTLVEKIKAAPHNDYEKAKWGELYKKSTEHAEEIEVHAYGEFPEKLIGSAFPNELKEETNYRRSSFQPTTKPYWKKALKKLNRIWAEQNYQIDWSDDTIREYFTEQTPIYKSTIGFFRSIATQSKVNDPNGVLVLDFDLPTKEIDGEIIVDDSKELEPYPSIYDSDDVLMFESGDFALLMSEEKSLVSFGNRMEQTGYVLYLYDKEYIYRISQTGKKIEFNFNVIEYYNHNLGYLPAWKLKGTPDKVINNEVYYESHFSGALPHLNEAVIIHSTNKGVRNKVSYPTRVYYEKKCNADGCSNGKVFNTVSNEFESCKSCNGTGQVRFSPFTDFVHELPTATNNTGNSEVSFPGFTYVSPDGTIIKDNEDVIDKYMSIAFSFINFEGTPDGAKAGLGEDATATKTKIDREEQFISILDISNELFELLTYYLNAAYKIRYNADSPIVVSPPKNFELTTSGEMTTELGEAKKNGMPSIAVSEMVVEYVAKKFAMNADIVRISEVAQYSDALFTKDDADIQILQTGGNIEKWEVVLHINFDVFMYEIMDEVTGWAEMDNKELKAMLIEKAKAKQLALDSGKTTASNLIKDIAGGGNDIGKIPLAIQQLALSRKRADEAGDSVLSNQLGNKIDELLKSI